MGDTCLFINQQKKKKKIKKTATMLSSKCSFLQEKQNVPRQRSSQRAWTYIEDNQVKTLYSRYNCTAWCSEMGSLTSLDVPELHASGDIREPISLHQAVLPDRKTHRTTDLNFAIIRFSPQSFLFGGNTKGTTKKPRIKDFFTKTQK